MLKQYKCMADPDRRTGSRNIGGRVILQSEINSR